MATPIANYTILMKCADRVFVAHSSGFLSPFALQWVPCVAIQTRKIASLEPCESQITSRPNGICQTMNSNLIKFEAGHERVHQQSDKVWISVELISSVHARLWSNGIPLPRNCQAERKTDEKKWNRGALGRRERKGHSPGDPKGVRAWEECGMWRRQEE